MPNPLMMNSGNLLGDLNGAVHVYQTDIPSPENTTAGMYRSGPVWKKVKVTATGAVPGVTDGHIFGGLSYISGTSPTAIAYDAASADTDNQLWAAAATVADKAPVNCLGKAADALTFGVELSTGLYLTVTGTNPVIWVWYA